MADSHMIFIVHPFIPQYVDLPLRYDRLLSCAFLLRGDAYRFYGLLALVIGWVFLGLALAFWRVTIRHYQSTGS
jgi:ABC-type uncharacterized transport system permease subunit